MLATADLARVASTFGVADEQVRRDHLIAHLLAAIGRLEVDSLVFFGGTALGWTHLPTGRLSEDVDLYAADRADVAARLDAAVSRALRREFPRHRWDPGLPAVRGRDSARLVTEDGLVVRVQLLDTRRQGWDHYPTERRALVARYADVAPPTLRVPTLPAFAAMKTVAWVDRHAARDLFDLAALAGVGALDTRAAGLFDKSVGRAVSPRDFDGPPPPDWDAALAHQTRHLRPATEQLAGVRRAYTDALGW